MIFGEEDTLPRLKWAFESCKNGAWGEEPDGEIDAVCIRAADFNSDLGQLLPGERTLRAIDNDTYRKVGLRPGDLVIEKSGGGEKQLVGRAVVYNGNDRAVCSNFLARCRPSELVTSEYLNYLMLAIYKARGTYPHIKQTTGIQNLDMASFLNTRVAFPHLDTQKRIAAFLDEKTAQIDALIEKKQTLLERLAEKRQAIITQAVTKGPNRDVAMKPTRINWLGEIPAHWEMKRLKYISPRITVGIVITPAAFYVDEGVLALRGLNIKPMRFDLTDTRSISDEGQTINRKSILKAGDLVAVRTGAPGTTSVVTDELAGCNCIDLVIIRKPLIGNPRFLGWYLNSDVAKTQYALGSEGALQSHFNIQTAGELIVALPNPEEQDEIVRQIEVALLSHDKQAEAVTASIERLSEYRSALITAAVTGRLEGLQ